jgi:hypothetical protein
VRLDNEAWLEDESQATISETYTLKLTDEYGYSNEDASHAYSLVVVKDQAPQVSLIGIPHRSAKDEPHILEPQLGSFGVTVKAKDDCGVSKVTVHYKIESLETNSEKSKDTRTRVFQLPQAEISQLPMLRMTETGAKVGDRIVFWAEVEDAYDLEPKKGPHKARTPAYRMAVVTKEEMFETFANKDTWTPNWYDDVKKAALSSREQPGRTAPESEEAAKVAAKLLDAPQMGDSVRGADQQLIQDYFNSLNVQR